MKIFINTLLILLLLLCSWLGKTALAQSTYKEIDVQNGGTIKGHVFFEGTGWKSESFVITKDQTTCGKTKPFSRLNIGKNNGIKDAIVYIERIPEGKKNVSRPIQVMDQKYCAYSPHIMILPRNSNLEIVNSDPILHNVHAYSTAPSSRSMFNIAQPIRGQRTTIKEKQFTNVSMVSVTCDAGHPWMSAYMMIADHPYVTITDDNGAFTLNQVPPGSYTLAMWHEGVSIIRTEMEGDKAKKYYFEDPYIDTQNIVVPGHETTTVNFIFELRGQMPESTPDNH